MSKEKDLKKKLILEQFPLSSKYDIGWLCENEMGISSVWLTEFLAEKLNIQKGMKVLDLGCGKALSSIFLAKEFQISVWALDWWISVNDNRERIKAQNLEKMIFPIQCECHNLPFEKDFFDIIVSLDSYHYYGTDEMFVEYIMDYMRPEGQLGIVVPSVYHEFNSKVPKRLLPYWEPYLFTHHSPLWWKKHLDHWNILKVTVADYMPNGYENWLLWDKTLKEANLLDRNGDVEMLETDGGNFTFARIVASKLQGKFS